MQERNERGQTIEEFLANYDPNRYQHPSVTVDMVVFTVERGELSVVLIARRDHPNIGRWALPGGFIEMSETLAQSAARELEEETGLRGVSMHPVGMFGEPTRDPRTRIITAAFAAYAPRNKLAIAAGDDAADARLFRVSLSKRDAARVSPQSARTHDVSLPCTACGEAHEPNGEEYYLTLFDHSDGQMRLCARLAVCKTPDGLGETAALLPAEQETCPEGESGLAGDHALILFSALRDMAKCKTHLLARQMEVEPYVLECALASLK